MIDIFLTLNLTSASLSWTYEHTYYLQNKTWTNFIWKGRRVWLVKCNSRMVYKWSKVARVLEYFHKKGNSLFRPIRKKSYYYAPDHFYLGKGWFIFVQCSYTQLCSIRTIDSSFETRDQKCLTFIFSEFQKFFIKHDFCHARMYSGKVWKDHLNES